MEIFTGLISGIGTSIGIGGGTILIVCLTFFLKIDQHIAQSINLLCFIPASLISIIYNLKKKNIRFKSCFLIITSGIIGALIGTYISAKINVFLLKKTFGIFLLAICIYEIYDLIKFIKNK